MWRAPYSRTMGGQWSPYSITIPHMRDKHYKRVSYRVDDPIIEQIKDLKESLGVTYNQLFILLLKEYEEKKK